MILPLCGGSVSRSSAPLEDDASPTSLRVVKVSFPTLSPKRPRPSVPDAEEAVSLAGREESSVAATLSTLFSDEEEDGGCAALSPLRLGRAAVAHFSSRNPRRCVSSSRSPDTSLGVAQTRFLDAVVKDCIFVPQFCSAEQIAASSAPSSVSSAGVGGSDSCLPQETLVRQPSSCSTSAASKKKEDVGDESRRKGDEFACQRERGDGKNEEDGASRLAKLRALLGTAGAAVGVSTLWRFPAYCHKWGGGSFLIPYVIFLLSLGVPILSMELALGQAFQGGIVKVLGLISPLLRGLAVGTLLLAFLISCSNSALVAWSLRFFAASFASPLPWIASDAQTAACSALTEAGICSSSNSAFSENAALFCRWEGSVDASSDAEGRCLVDSEAMALYFLHSKVLQNSVTSSSSWELYFVVFGVWTLAFLVSLRGSRGAAAVSACAVLLPAFCLAAILWKSLALSGAAEGVLQLARVDWQLLAREPAVWGEALSQVLFSLGLFQGVVAAFAGSSRTSLNATGGALVVALWTCVVSVLAAAAAFAVGGAMNAASGSVRGLALAGPQLLFVLFPVGLARLPFAHFFCELFFFAFAVLGLSNIVCVVHALLDLLRDARGIPLHTPRWQLAFWPCLCGALLSFPFTLQSGLWIVEAADALWGVAALLFVGACECLAVGWGYGLTRQTRLVGKPAVFILFGGFVCAVSLGGMLGFFGRSYATTAVALTCAAVLWLSACVAAVALGLGFARAKRRATQRVVDAANAVAAWRAQMAETLGDDFAANGFADAQPSDAVFDAGCWAPPSGVQTAAVVGFQGEVAAAAATLPAGGLALDKSGGKSTFRDICIVAHCLFVANVEHLRRHLNLMTGGKGSSRCRWLRLPPPWSLLVRYVAPAVVTLLFADALRLEFISKTQDGNDSPLFPLAAQLPVRVRAFPLALLSALVACVAVGLAAPDVFSCLDTREVTEANTASAAEGINETLPDAGGSKSGPSTVSNQNGARGMY